MSESLVFLGAKRTPFGGNGGSLKAVGPVELSVAASQAALTQSGVSPESIDHVIFGNVLCSSADAIYTPRHVGLKLGIPMDRPALGINRLCGSGFQVVIEAYQQFQTGDSSVALVGGVENMSMAPYLLRNARWGMRMGHQPVTDMLMEGLTDLHVNLPMAMTAENLATQYELNRETCDRFALESQGKFQKALEGKRFVQEIVEMEALKVDEHPRPQATMEALLKLKPVFKKDGVVTAGNASGIVDGAAALVVSTESAAKRMNLKPLGRMVGYSVVGCDPKIMGIGPVPAIRKLLEKTGMSLNQIDLVEVNEAFAPQCLAVARELQIDPARLNVNGGAIAVGHPLGASGTRILATLLYELRRQKKKYGIGSACIGGGQGIAVLVEAFSE